MGVVSASRQRPALVLLVALLSACLGLSACATGEPLVKPDFSKAKVRIDSGERDFKAIESLLARRSKAVLTGDRAAFLATVDKTNAKLRRRQAIVFDNLQELPVQRIYYGVEHSALVADKLRGRARTLRPPVVEHVQLRGVNRRPVSNEVTMTFVKRGGRWVLGNEREDSSFEAQERPWYGARIDSAGDGKLLVLTDEDAKVDADELLGSTRSALAAVVDVLDEEPSRPLLVDATTNGEATELSNASGEDAGAVFFSTYASDRLGSEFTGVAGAIVKANPKYVTQLVEDDHTLRHELTHYVLDGYGDTNPQWVTEGIAEYVGYRPGLLSKSYITDDELTGQIDARPVELTLPGRWGNDPALDYLSAQAFAEFLITRGGLDKYRRMMDLFKKYAASRHVVYGEGIVDEVLKKVYGLSAKAVARGGFDLLEGLSD